MSGIGDESIWKEVKGQTLLGGEAFVKKLMSYAKGKEEIQEIPRQQRFAGRPYLQMVFNKDTEITRRERNRKIAESVEKYNYSQKEVADYLGLHYSAISRLLKRTSFHSKIKDPLNSR